MPIISGGQRLFTLASRPTDGEVLPMVYLRKNWRQPTVARLLGAFGALAVASVAHCAQVNLADGFDFPVGKPNAEGYYKSRGLRLRSPQHFGEDWNGRAGGDTDKGDPVYAIADGIVTFAYNVRTGWGNVVLTRHGYRDPATGQVQFVDTLNGHLDRMMVTTGQAVKRGQQIGTIGTNSGMYPAHLHFEIRHDLTIGMARTSQPSDMVHWADPTQFINQYRRLKPEWRPVAVPTGTFADYAGCKGL